MSCSTPRNIFSELGYSQTEIDRRLAECWSAIFEGPEKFYFEVPGDMAFITDTGHNDVRTEGMSYGMMMAVQMDRQDIFDKLWKWSMTYMYNHAGVNSGYFGWSCKLNGEKNSYIPAPDGEEFFAMALFFASRRWGDRRELFNYSERARELLSTCLHQGTRPGDSPDGQPLWEVSNFFVKFFPHLSFSDPSYHLPHFYELYGKYANTEDKQFWKQAAGASRDYIALCCDKETGLAPEYANYDGTPNFSGPPVGHGDFSADSYRVALNIGLDAQWFGVNEPLSLIAGKIVCFFADKETIPYYHYRIDGTPLPADPNREDKAYHPTALIATNAAAAPAILEVPSRSDTEKAASQKAVELFWNTRPRTGIFRYYDNCLYFFSSLVLSGRYHIY